MSSSARIGWANLDPLVPPSSSVLIVEDDEAAARGLARAVREIGCSVRVAGCAESADRWIASEEFDLVLLDIGLPRMNGIEFLHWVLSRSPTTAVIMVTGNDDIATAIQCISGGARTYLVKPIDLEVLRLAVLDALAMRTLLRTYLSKGPHD